MKSRVSNMLARRLDFAAPLPRFAVYLDSSFILNFISKIQNREEEFQKECEQFLKRLQTEAESTGLCLATSDFAMSEICYQIIKFELEKKLDEIDPSGKLFRGNFLRYFRDAPEAIQLAIPKIERFYEVIETIPIFVISYSDLKEIERDLYLQAKNLIKLHNLLPTDAYHVAIGKSVGIGDFVAVDRDWFRIGNINLYTCLPGP